jgi:NitT/TauT family transport system substrate-binding protein
MTQWLPQAQFAGYCVAQKKVFYRERGLAVEFRAGGPNEYSWGKLAKGEVDLSSMFLATDIRQRAQGVRLLNVAQIVRHSAFLLLARKTSGVRRLEDLADKRVAVWSDEFGLPAVAYFKKAGVSPRLITQPPTMSLFLWGAVDAASAMSYNEIHQLYDAGIDADELTVFPLKDLGFDFAEDGIYCMEELFAKEPGQVCDFVQASLRGWQYAFDNSVVHQRWMLNQLKSLILGHGNEPPLGTLDHAAFDSVAQALKTVGLITCVPEMAEFVRVCQAAAGPTEGR